METDPSGGRSERERVKRQLLFVSGEDYYFLTYAAIITLAEFKCTTPEHSLQDFRKLAFAAEFIGSERLLRVLEHYSAKERIVDPEDRTALSLAHDRSVARIAVLYRLLYALESRELISVTARQEVRLLDVSLNAGGRAKQILESELFKVERKRAHRFHRGVHFFRTAKLETILQQMFGRFGIATWLA